MKKVKYLDLMKENNQFLVKVNYHDYYSNKGTNKRLLKELIRSNSLSLQEMIFYEEDENWIFVDGMERFTTMYLLLCAICSKFYENNELEEYNYIIDNYLLFNEKKSLVLREKDDEHLSNIVNEIIKTGSYNESCDSGIVDTYNHFISVLDNRQSSVKTSHYNVRSIYKNLYKAKCKIEKIVGDDSFRKFIECNQDSMTKKQMQNILIKNYFLDKLNYTYVDDFIAKWTQLENIQNIYFERFEKKNYHFFDHFLKIYFTIKLDYTIEYDNLYEIFIECVKDYELKDVYEDIFRYGNYYMNMFLNCEKDYKLNSIFYNITQCGFVNRLDNNVLSNKTLYSYDEMQVFLLKVYDDYDNKIIDKEELTFITECIESYIVRRDICDITYDDLSNTFIELYQNIDKNHYTTSFINEITGLNKNKIFPKDDEIRKELLLHDFYKEDDIKKYVLERLENSLRREPINIKDYHIEHVMPRTLNNEWYEYLGENADKINTDYGNTIGNLTLLKQESNISLSNSSFDDKINRKEVGYKYSDIKLSDDIIKKKEWNENIIKQRSANLAERIIDIWHYPQYEDYQHK